MGYENEHAGLVALLRANRQPWHHVASVVESAGTAEGLIRGEVEPANNFVELLVAAVDESHLENAQEEVKGWSERPGLVAWSILDSEYPARLREVYNRPPFIFCRGKWIEDVDSQGLAVVGTRKPTERGLAEARRVAQELAQRQITVLSGLALGIDAAAHEEALAEGARTIAVLGSGLDQIYPPEHKDLAGKIIASGGALISPFVPSQPPNSRFTFQIRNSVMSGLSRGTIVVEAGPTSGAKMQARLSLEHGRPVYLLGTLVDTFDWAKDYAEKGRYGARAVVVKDVQGIFDALSKPPPIDREQLRLSLD